MPQWKPKVEGGSEVVADGAIKPKEKSEKADQAKGNGKNAKGKAKGTDKGNSKGKGGYQTNWQGKDGYQANWQGKDGYQASWQGKDGYQGQGKGQWDYGNAGKGNNAYQAKGNGKDASRDWQPKDLAETYKSQLQTQACQILYGKSDGICGGHLSQLLTEADGASVVAAFGTTGADGQNGPNGSKLQRGWLHSLMRGLPNVSCERHGGGRDNMYTLKPGVAQPPVMNVAAAQWNAQYVAATPAANMRPGDFLGDWKDSLGNLVSVLKDTKDAQFKVVLKQPPRKDVILYMFQTSLGGGYVTWGCGNSYMQLESSTSMQLCWFAMDGRMSVWMRAPATTALKAPVAQIAKAPSTNAPAAVAAPALPAAPKAKGKFAASLLKGLRSGEVSKLVDDMEKAEKAAPETVATNDVKKDETPSASKE